jgi:Predicted periplasmic lipoprotein (DUF2279)
MSRAVLLLSSSVASSAGSRGHTASFRIKNGLSAIALLFRFAVFAQHPDAVQLIPDTSSRNILPAGQIPAKYLSGKWDKLDTSSGRLLSQTLNTGTHHGPEAPVYKKRKWLIGGINVAGYGGSLLLLSQAWYKDYPKTKLHSFNDSKEWLQTDKAGHAWAAYNTGRASTAMWKWAGLSPKKATLIGGFSGAAYLTVIEILDGHSAEWGWSWADMGANLLGSGLFMSQELAWQQQRIQFKFSFHKKNYGEAQLNKRADDLFGKSWYERMLKDYNGQTYWFSANIKSFFPKSRFPAWLNVAVGYGADGLLGGFENRWTEGDPGFPINRSDIPRKRQFYIAPDIDLTKIKTKSKLLRTVFSGLNSFKFPAPALQIDNKGRFRFYPFYF